MSSQNPGISAAGRALGRTALNPASGPAAIGGMLQAGQPEEDPWEGDLSDVRSRLSKAISDITKLANAVEALAVKVVPEGDPRMATYVCRPSAGTSRRGWIGRRRAEPRRPCDALPATDFISISSPDGIGPGNRAKLGNGAGEQRFVNGRSTC